MVEAAGKPKSGWSVFRRVLREQDAYWRQLVTIGVLSSLHTPLGLLAPVAMMLVVDSYLGDEPLPGPIAAWTPDGLLASPHGVLWLAVGIILVTAVLTQSIGFVTKILRTSTKERLVLGFRARLFPHVERLSLSYHDQKGAADSTFRVLMDTAVIPGVVIDGLIPMVQSGIFVVIVGIAIALLSWQLALVAIVVAPIMLLVSWPYGRKLRKEWHDIKELDSSAMSLLQEAFGAVRVIKAFGNEERETTRLLELARQGMEARVRVAVTQGQFTALLGLFTALGTASFLAVGAYLVNSDILTLGQLVLVATLMVQFYSPLQQFVGQVASMQSALASAERALALLDEAPEVIQRDDARGIERAVGAIEFDDVRFAYEDDKVVIDGVSFRVEPGQRIGIAGSTGAGKTTLMNLLTRLYDPVSGAIRLDGIDLRDLIIDDLRSQFSIVLQEPVLFKKSIGENIRYALPGATDEQVAEAARLANAHEFIEAMPEGYQTVVGERGQRLSGGERQRIALARSFLKDAPLLILDEPTSSVDMRTEAAIMDALERLMRGRTTFIIAHRPSTLQTCDRVLVLDAGRIVKFAAPSSVGSLDELMLATHADES